MEKINKLVDLLDLEQSEWAVEWMEKNGKIKDIEKLQKYLEEEFVDPLGYILETMNDYLESINNN
jgi:hypothetical protein